MEKIELLQGAVSAFVWFRIEVSGDAFHSDVLKHVEMRMRLREVPVLLWPKNFEFLVQGRIKTRQIDPYLN